MHKAAKPPLLKHAMPSSYQRHQQAEGGVAHQQQSSLSRSKIKLSRSKDNARASSGGSVPRQVGARTSSAHGPPAIRRKAMQLLPDRTTTKMASLKSVKFLDPEFDAPSRPDDATMGAEYLRKKDRLDKSLQRVIDKTKVAHMQILKKSKEEIEKKKKQEAEEAARINPLAKLMGGGRANGGEAEEKKEEEEKFADGFVRSKRNTEMRVKQELLSQIRTVEEEKTSLIQKMNKALIQLDKQNSAKRELGEKLLEQVKFVRDLQIAASKGDDISGVVSDQMKSDFQREKELNERLKAELQRCEKERLRLLDRIKLLSGEKQIEVEESDGVRRTFKVTQINIQKILDELRIFKESAASNQAVVDQSREVLRAAEEEIISKERQLQQLRHEIENLNHDFSMLENKYRDTIYLNEGARDHLGGLHRMHVKLLATRQLEETLDKALTRSKKNSIDQMLWVTRGYVNQFGAIYRLRNLLKHQNERAAKNALARWFKLACDPMMLVEQNRQIPEFFAKHHAERLVFNREFEQWMLSQGLKSHQDSQLDIMRGCIHKFWNRELKLRFQMWKDNVRARKLNLKAIDRALTKMVYFEKARAFTKWNSFLQEQNYHTRLHGMALITALKQAKQGIFYSWRTWTQARKAKQRALKKRVLRQLRVAVQRRKHLAKMALSALGFQIQADRSIMKQCFDYLRQSKEDEKLTFVRDKLTVETEPECTKLRSQINQISDRSDNQAKKRGTVAIMTLFGRLLSQAFHRWKNCSQYKAVELNNNFKIRLIKLYRSKLGKAFNLWKVNRAAMVIEMQTMEFEDIQGQNTQIEEACRENEVKIKAADRSSKNMGAKHMRKLVIGAFQKHLKAYLDRWRKANAYKSTQVKGSQTILNKIRKRYLKMAWNRYRYAMTLMEQEAKNENRLEEVRIRLNYRQKRRTFRAIQGYNERNMTARKWLKTLVSGNEKANKETAFSRWKHFNNQETSMKLMSEVHSLKEHREELKVEYGHRADKLMRAKDKSVRAANQLNQNCQKTLKKWAVRLINHNIERAFKKWKENTRNVKSREQLVTSLKKQMLRNTLRCAIARWKQLLQKDKIQFAMEEITTESLNLGIEESKVQKALKNHRRELDRSSRRQREVGDDVLKQKQIYENMVVTLTKKNQGNFFTSKLNHLFHGWKRYTERRRRCCEILSQALRKTVLQQTFTRINQFQREKDRDGRKGNKAGKMFRIYSKFRLKAALSKWREHEYQNMVVLCEQTTEQMNVMTESHNVHRENIKQHHAAVRSARTQKRTIADWFSAWQVYASEERDIRMRTKHLQEALRAQQGRKALVKWKMQSEKTVQMRAFLRRSKFVRAGITLRSTFRAWKQLKTNEKNFGHRLTVLMEGIRNVNTQSAFDMIKRYAAERTTRGGRNRDKGIAKMQRCLGNFSEFRLRAYFNKMCSWRDRCRAREAKMRAALKNMSVAHIRSAFENWKNKAHQCAIYSQNEHEDGPRNLEAWQLRQDNFNLIKLMKEDGLTTKDITRVHQQGEQKYLSGVEKSLCRLLCKQTDGLSILPACMDRWKKFAKLRKVWRRVIKDTDIRATYHDDMAKKLWAFRRLQYTHEDRQQVLWGRPIAQLRTLCVKNVEKLDRLADKVEQSDANIGDLTEQRNTLIKGQISGQKLAFSLSVSNQQRTKMVAMSKFQDYGTKRLQSKIELAIKANLDRIGDLKSTISQFERENETLAQQNDQFRRGAMDGITMVRHVEALTADRDKLSVDLADKALTIRKLLEDNQYLQNRLSNAKTQTAAIIEIAKTEVIKRQRSREAIPVRESSNSPLRLKNRENDQRMMNGATV